MISDIEAKKGKGIEDLLDRFSPDRPEDVRAVPVEPSLVGKILAAYLYWQDFFANDSRLKERFGFDRRYFNHIFDLPPPYKIVSEDQLLPEIELCPSVKNQIITPESIEEFLRCLPTAIENDLFTGNFLNGLIQQSFQQGYSYFTVKPERPIFAHLPELDGNKERYLQINLDGEWAMGKVRWCHIQYRGDTFYVPSAEETVFTVESKATHFYLRGDLMTGRDKNHQLENVVIKSTNLDLLHQILEHYREDKASFFTRRMGYGPDYRNLKLTLLRDDTEEEVCILDSCEPATLWKVNPQMFPQAQRAKQYLEQPIVQEAVKDVAPGGDMYMLRSKVMMALNLVAYETGDSMAVAETASSLSSHDPIHLFGIISAFAYYTKSGRCVRSLIPMLKKVEKISEHYDSLVFIAKKIIPAEMEVLTNHFKAITGLKPHHIIRELENLRCHYFEQAMKEIKNPF